jgi:iron complex outermembrane receptor protein
MVIFVGNMKNKVILLLVSILCAMPCFAQIDSLVYTIDEVSVVSLFNGSGTNTSEFTKEQLVRNNYGQEPANLFAKNPSIISLNDNGTEFGYGYFRIRGLDQTRINVMLDGCPWNEAEDFGSYFANSPDLMSSMENIAVNRGTSSNNNGIAGSAGSVNLESVNIWHDNDSYVHLGGGSFNSFKSSIIITRLLVMDGVYTSKLHISKLMVIGIMVLTILKHLLLKLVINLTIIIA